MDRTERFYRILNLLNARRSVSRAEFLAELEVSPATFKRDLEYLRDRLEAPVVWDREAGGYRLTASDGRFQLPGLWLTQPELLSLLVAEALLTELEPALIGEMLAPLREQIDRLMHDLSLPVSAFRERIRIVGGIQRPASSAVLRTLLEALASERRLDIAYLTRGRGETSTRTISPQRLIRYNDNWYVDAWCHLRDDLRTFSLDAMTAATLSEESALKVAPARLDAHVHPGFGIFSGDAVQWAHLQFSASAARWVSAEQWHPEQRGRWSDDGTYLLEVPFTEDHELLMEILKFGAACRVLSPTSLQARVGEEAARLAALYAEPHPCDPPTG